MVRDPGYRGISATSGARWRWSGRCRHLRGDGTPYCGGKGRASQVIRVGHASPACKVRARRRGRGRHDAGRAPGRSLPASASPRGSADVLIGRGAVTKTLNVRTSMRSPMRCAFETRANAARCCSKAESSDFIRFNRAAVRQTTPGRAGPCHRSKGRRQRRAEAPRDAHRPARHDVATLRRELDTCVRCCPTSPRIRGCCCPEAPACSERHETASCRRPRRWWAA